MWEMNDKISRDILKKNSEIFEMKSSINQIKNSVETLNKLDHMEERISTLEDKSFEIFFFHLFFGDTGFELRALYLQGRHSTI
jgi:hypothetical protein